MINTYEQILCDPEWTHIQSGPEKNSNFPQYVCAKNSESWLADIDKL